MLKGNAVSQEAETFEACTIMWLNEAGRISLLTA
jgi:hypothetical protein